MKRLSRRGRLVLSLSLSVVAIVVVFLSVLAVIPPSWQGLGDWQECNEKVPIKASDAVLLAAAERGVSNLHLRMGGERITVRPTFVNATGVAHEVDCRDLSVSDTTGPLVEQSDGEDHFGWIVAFHEGGYSLTVRLFLVDWSSGEVALSFMVV